MILSLIARDNPEWVADCMKWRGEVLTGEKSHWCDDWDGLPMDETCGEYKAGTCHRFEAAPPPTPAGKPREED